MLSFDAAKNFYSINKLTAAVFGQFFDYCLVLELAQRQNMLDIKDVGIALRQFCDVPRTFSTAKFFAPLLYVISHAKEIVSLLWNNQAQKQGGKR